MTPTVHIGVFAEVELANTTTFAASTMPTVPARADTVAYPQEFFVGSESDDVANDLVPRDARMTGRKLLRLNVVISV